MFSDTLLRPGVYRVPLFRASRRWIHGQFYTCSRLRPRQQLHVRGPGQILWTYFTAPSNLLFVSTNLLTFGILATWRGLSTLAAHEKVEIGDDLAVLEPPELMNMDKSTRLLSSPKHKEKSILDDVDTSVFNADERFGRTKGSFIGDDVDLPLTEDELNDYGPSSSRDVKSERVQNAVVDQLLSIYSAHEQLSSSLESGLSAQMLDDLGHNEKEMVLRSLLHMVDQQEQSITSFQDLLDRIPSDSIREEVASISPTALLENLHTSKEKKPITHDEAQEQTPRTYTRHHQGQQLMPLVAQFSTTAKFSPSFILSAVAAVLNTSFNVFPYHRFFNLLEAEPKNENFQILGNTIGEVLLRKNHIYSERNLIHIVRQAITANNKALFSECLHRLQLSDETSFPKNLIYNVTNGESTMSVAPYVEILDGLLQLGYDEGSVMEAVNRTIAGVRQDRYETDKFFVVIKKDMKRSSMRAAEKAWESLPTDLIEVIIKIGVKFENELVLKWCADLVKKRVASKVRQGVEVKQEMLTLVCELDELGLWA